MAKTQLKKDTVRTNGQGAGLDRRQWIKRPPVTELGRRIVSATADEFDSRGVLGARVAQITRRAGTTDPAFYRYFAGIKQAALFIMSEYYWAPLNLRLNHYRDVSDDPLRLFDTVLEALIRSTSDDPDRLWLSELKVFRIVVVHMRNPALLPEALLDSEYLTFISSLVKIISAGQRRGVFSSDLRPAVLAQLLVITVHGLLMLNTIPVQPVNIQIGEVKKVVQQLIGIQR